jgi:uncharacterized membrane protein YedE/YeeE
VTSVPYIVLFAGFVIGLVFGVVGLLSNFCLTSGLRNWWTKGDGVLIRTFAVALAVAVVGTQLLAAGDVVEIGKSIYLQPSFSAPVILLGGLLFGYGMVMANACGSRALVLVGRGNLRSLVVIVTIAVTAQMTLKGLFAPARLVLLRWSEVAPQAISLPGVVSTAGLSTSVAQVVAVAIIAGALLVFAFSHVPFRQAPGQIAAGIAVGLLIPAGWLATGYLGADDFEPVPVTSLSFVAPLADSLQYMMLATGLTLNFGIAVVAGVLVGSFGAALLTRRFQWEGYSSPGHLLRSLGGAALMGCGGAMAYGCTVGQGLTGLSTLALPSFVAAAGIVLGAAIALRGPVRVPTLAAA